MTCSKDGCFKPVHCKGMCKSHYEYARRISNGNPCRIDGCARSRMARGMCSVHYYREKRHGNPRVLKKVPNGSLAHWIEEHKHHAGEGCLTWPFGRDPQSGYARMGGGKGVGFASRAMCIAAHGEPPTPIHQAAHSCGKGHLGCVNPLHLSWKTPKENNADKLLHGTLERGERVYNAKLTERDVRLIRRLCRIGVNQRAIARRFNVPPQRISRIKLKQAWAWVE